MDDAVRAAHVDVPRPQECRDHLVVSVGDAEVRRVVVHNRQVRADDAACGTGVELPGTFDVVSAPFHFDDESDTLAARGKVGGRRVAFRKLGD